MLGKDYLSINGNKIPNPTSFGISYTNVETVKTAEDGKDVGTATRLGKRTFDFAFTSTSRGRDKIKTYCLLAQSTLTYQGENITGRLRLKSEKLLSGTEYLDRTDGLYTLSVSFAER